MGGVTVISWAACMLCFGSEVQWIFPAASSRLPLSFVCRTGIRDRNGGGCRRQNLGAVSPTKPRNSLLCALDPRRPANLLRPYA